MILEDATKEAFNHYPSELTPESNKPILATCDDCGKVCETSKNGYCALCRSCSKKGDKHPFFGKEHTEETKALISTSHKGMIFTDEHKANLSIALIGMKKVYFI